MEKLMISSGKTALKMTIDTMHEIVSSHT